MRISRHQMAMQIAEVVSRRATCFRRNVGAVITIDHRLCSVGYNGPASGEEHCKGLQCSGASGGCTRAIHAEKNALTHLQSGVRGRIWRMYTTESPCPDCAGLITGFPIKQVFYLHQYRLTEGCDMLLRRDVEVYRMTPAGHFINYRTGELVEVEE